MSAHFICLIFSGVFRGIIKCDISTESGMIEWNSNYVVFMDNMLQMLILNKDSRNLHVPTGIERVVIDPRIHRKYKSESEIDVYALHQSKYIRYGSLLANLMLILGS